MKKFFGKIKSLIIFIKEKIKGLFSKIPTPVFWTKIKNSKTLNKYAEFGNKHVVISQIILSMLMIFVMEWLSRHSFISAVEFVTHHLGAYLYNCYLVFTVYSLVFLVKKRTTLRMTISAVWVMLGITNCIILLNRVTPFGYTDLYMIGDLLTMQNTNYFSAQQAALATAAIVVYAIYLVRLFMKDKGQVSKHKFGVRLAFVLALFISIVPVTHALRSAGILTSYFGNLAQGYKDYGYLYGFSTSTFDRGMSKPYGYSDSEIKKIVAETEKPIDDEVSKPNIIVVLLESMYDVSECDFIETSEDPLPYLHYLEENYSAGHLTVPVVGAGTCNSEFEVLTGMSCQFFGPGEYPQKTILKETDCESFASVLSKQGYGTHVVHNNGGNFYSRANAFSMMGFDTFQSKEMLDITDYTPLGSWPTDDILIDSTVEAMDRTESPDFVYTITVEAHGDYPSHSIIENPPIKVKCNGKTEGQNYQWEYYINMIYNVDDFVRLYVEALDARDEDTLLIMFGDHLPTMGLVENEIATGDLFQTKYFTWNNFGMEKKDADLTSYQLVAEYADRLGIHGGTIGNYHQTKMEEGVKAGSRGYMGDLEMLQYDLLYGKRYAYNGGDDYPASDLEMGVSDVVIDRAYFFDGKLHVYGKNFTKWSKVFVNGQKVTTSYESGQCLTIDKGSVANNDVITVCQMGSNNTVFRESNEYTVVDPNANQDEEVVEE